MRLGKALTVQQVLLMLAAEGALVEQTALPEKTALAAVCMAVAVEEPMALVMLETLVELVLSGLLPEQTNSQTTHQQTHAKQ